MPLFPTLVIPLLLTTTAGRRRFCFPHLPVCWKETAARFELSGARLAEESSPKRGVAAEEEEGECAICLESLGSGVEILECGHRFHKACVDELIKRDVQQACPLCRVELPYNPKKREG